jgi:hypothetical protein
MLKYSDFEEGLFMLGSSVFFKIIILLIWKPLNVITLGQIETNNINQMITISRSLAQISYLIGRILGLD